MRKILVIDDDTGIVDVLKEILGSAGYRVETYTGIEDYILKKKGRRALPDLILLDVFISGLDGRELCREIRLDNRTKNIPIIMMSANHETKQDTIEAGANEFLNKPFDIDALLAKVQKYVY